MVGIESGLVHNIIAQLSAESGEGGSPCLVIVEVTGYYGIVREDSQCFADIGDGVENHRVKAVIQSEAFRRKKVDKALEHVAPWISPPDAGDVFRRKRAFPKPVPQLIQTFG